MIKSKKVFTYIVFVLPALVIYLSVISFPVVSSVGLSFTKYNIYKGVVTWVGLANYIKIFKDPIFWFSIRNNVFIMFVTIFGELVLGFILAYILYRKSVKFSLFFQAMLFLPNVIATIIIGILWSTIFSPIGIYTKIIQFITRNPDYTMTIVNSRYLAMIPIGFVYLWVLTGFYTVIYLAYLQNIDPSTIEAAQIDGATESQVVRKVIIPQLYGPITFTTILALTQSFGAFDIVFALTQGGPSYYTSLLSLYMYKYSFVNSNFGVGTAVSTFMVSVSIILVSLIRFIRRRIDTMGV